jgi:hypothetical protein
MYLSPHFTLAEFTTSQTADRLGIENDPPIDVLENLKRTAMGLEGIRIMLGSPIIITSGYRCLELNRAIGSKDTSQHVKGEAADFICPGFGGPRTIVDRLMDSELGYDQLILEYANKGRGWVHISFTKASGRHQALIIDETGARPFMA